MGGRQYLASCIQNIFKNTPCLPPDLVTCYESLNAELLTFWQGKCQWMSIEQNTWHDSLYFVLPDGKYRYSSLIISSRSGYSGPRSDGRIWSLLPLSLFWARLRLSETQSDIFILKACLFSDSDNHHSCQSRKTSNNNKIINVDHESLMCFYQLLNPNKTFSEIPWTSRCGWEVQTFGKQRIWDKSTPRGMIQEVGDTL